MSLNIKYGVNLNHASEPVIDSSKLRSDTMTVDGFNGAYDFKRSNYYMGVYQNLKHWVLNAAVPMFQELNDSGTAPTIATTSKFGFMPAITGGANVTQDRLYCVGTNINSWMNINTKAWTAGTGQVISGGVKSLEIPNKYQLSAYPNAEGIMYCFNPTYNLHYKKDEETPAAWAALANSASGIGTGFANHWTWNTNSGDCIYRLNTTDNYTISVEKYTISTNAWATVATGVKGPNDELFCSGNKVHTATDGTYIYMVLTLPFLPSSSLIDPFRIIYRLNPLTVATGDTLTPFSRIRISDIYTTDTWYSGNYNPTFIATFDGIKYLYESTHYSTRMVTWRVPLPD